MSEKRFAGEQRKSNIELLRILCMLGIIAHHYVVYGLGSAELATLSFNGVVQQLLLFGGKFGVNCFMLISGYFLVDSSFRLSRLVKLLLQMIFYSLGIYLVLAVLGYVSFSPLQFFKSLLPFVYTGWWFATGYLVLYLLSPFINMLVKKMQEYQMLMLIGVLVLIWCLVPTFTLGDISFSTLGWFITLYLIGAYIKLYPRPFFMRGKLNALLAVSLFVLIILSSVVIALLGTKWSVFSSHTDFFMGMNKLPMLLCSVFCFIAFLNLNIGSKKVINNVSKTAFGIYLLHEATLLRPVLWEKLFNNAAHASSPYLIFHAIIAVLSIFIAGYLIDRLRLLLESLIFRLSFMQRIDTRALAIKTRFVNKLSR